jgi:hypothetical protein
MRSRASLASCVRRASLRFAASSVAPKEPGPDEIDARESARHAAVSVFERVNLRERVVEPG